MKVFGECVAVEEVLEVLGRGWPASGVLFGGSPGNVSSDPSDVPRSTFWPEDNRALVIFRSLRAVAACRCWQQPQPQQGRQALSRKRQCRLPARTAEGARTNCQTAQMLISACNSRQTLNRRLHLFRCQTSRRFVPANLWRRHLKLNRVPGLDSLRSAFHSKLNRVTYRSSFGICKPLIGREALFV